MRRPSLRSPELESWRRSWQEGMSAGGAGCPPDETLAALVIGEAENPERAALADHVSSCRRCAQSFRTLLELDREAGRLRRRRIPPTAWAAAAAIAVVALAGGVLWLGPGLRAPQAVDGGALRAPAAALRPAADAVLAEPPESFSWTPQAGATGYRVRLYDESAGLIWESPAVVESSAPLAAPPSLATGGAYFWTVEVEGPAVRSRLGPFWFRIGG